MSSRIVSTIDWKSEGSVGKRYTDLEVMRDIDNAGLVDIWRTSPAVPVFNLSASQLLFEEALITQIPDVKWHLYPIERDADVYRELSSNANEFLSHMKKTVNKQHVRFLKHHQIHLQPKPISVEEYFASMPNVIFKLIVLDYMGTWSQEKEADLASIFASQCFDDSILVLTISSARGNRNTTERLLQFNHTNTLFGAPLGNPLIYRAKTQGLCGLIVSLANAMGIQCNLLGFYPYKAKKDIEYKFMFQIRRTHG